MKYGMVEIEQDGERWAIKYPEWANPYINECMKKATDSVLNDGTMKGFAMALHYKIAEIKGLLSLGL